MPMTRQQWEEQARKNAGRDWNPADAENQWRMHQIRLQTGQTTDRGAYDRIQSGQQAGFNTGHPMYDYARQHGMSEDFARFDPATLTVWEDQKDSACPPGAPYRSYQDGSCVEKPIDTGGGMGGGAGRQQMPATAPTGPQAAPFQGGMGQTPAPNLAQMLSMRNQMGSAPGGAPGMATGGNMFQPPAAPVVGGGLQGMMAGFQGPLAQGAQPGGSGLLGQLMKKRQQPQTATNRGGWFSGGL